MRRFLFVGWVLGLLLGNVSNNFAGDMRFICDVTIPETWIRPLNFNSSMPEESDSYLQEITDDASFYIDFYDDNVFEENYASEEADEAIEVSFAAFKSKAGLQLADEIPVEIVETEDMLEARVDIRNLEDRKPFADTQGNLNVTVSDGKLIVLTELLTPFEEPDKQLRGMYLASSVKEWELPCAVEEEKAEAVYEDDCILVRIPKKMEDAIVVDEKVIHAEECSEEEVQ